MNNCPDHLLMKEMCQHHGGGARNEWRISKIVMSGRDNRDADGNFESEAHLINEETISR